jgi:citrate lyase synthetase
MERAAETAPTIALDSVKRCQYARDIVCVSRVESIFLELRWIEFEKMLPPTFQS